MGQGRGCGAAQTIIAAHAAELRKRRRPRITAGASPQHCDRRRLLAARPANEGVDLLHCASAAVEKAPCVKCQAYMTSCVSATAGILSDALSRPAPRPAPRACAGGFRWRASLFWVKHYIFVYTVLVPFIMTAMTDFLDNSFIRRSSQTYNSRYMNVDIFCDSLSNLEFKIKT